MSNDFEQSWQHKGRGPLCQKVARDAFLWHPPGEHLVRGLFERNIGTILFQNHPLTYEKLKLDKTRYQSQLAQ